MGKFGNCCFIYVMMPCNVVMNKPSKYYEILPQQFVLSHVELLSVSMQM